MKPTWDMIIDYARGLASPDVKAMVEADSEAMARAKNLSLVSPALQVDVPESFVNRAKALMPKLPSAAKVWQGRLVFQSSGMMPGFRSAETLARDLRFEFDQAACDLRIEPIANSERIWIAGIFSTDVPEHVKAVAGPKNEAWCDEFGQFVLEAPQNLSQLSFVNATTGETYNLDLK